MRSITTVFIVAVMTLVLSVAPALAVGVSSNCGSDGGEFFTKATATDWQDHTHDGVMVHYWYYGKALKSTHWGPEYGWQFATIEGPSLSGPQAACYPF